jgi:phage recombination protein Bet
MSEVFTDEMALTPIERQEVVEVQYDRGTIETVKRVVFPKSTDDELRIYLYKCLIVGVHPLSGMLIPVKYGSGDDAKLAFTSTIDLFRSKAQESGEYDGQDEPEFNGVDTFEYDQETITHPKFCTVKVYRKNIGRPFVATAAWDEYYPGHKRGTMWRKMPRVMLAKCAEALAIRKGFPDKLGRVYAVEEMEQAAENQHQQSTKPPMEAPREAAQEAPPSQEIDLTRCISEAQRKRLYAIAKKAGADVDKIKLWLKYNGANRSDSLDHITKGAEYDRICQTSEKRPDFFNNWQPPAEKTPETALESTQTVQPTQTTSEPLAQTSDPASVRDTRNFEVAVSEMCKTIGVSEEELAKELEKIAGVKLLINVPADKRMDVLKRMNQLADAQIPE